MEVISSSKGLQRLELNIRESNSLKGIALILLLIHHLFYIQNGKFDDVYIAGHGVVNTLGLLCKVCVAMFVFLSGYGLELSIAESSKLNIKWFYKRRFTKLFFNYWLIWLLFVPLGIFFFNRSLESVYGEGGLVYGLLDLFGLIDITGRHGYNPTWWFYSCIILLYIIFPFIIFIIGKWPKSTWLLLLGSVVIVKLPLKCIESIRYYLFPFILGVCLGNRLFINSLPPPIIKFLNPIFTGSVKIGGLLVLLLLLITSCLIRLTIPYALLWDTLIAVIIIFLYKSTHNLVKRDMALNFVGKHSFNIFLFHTFIYYLYFPFVIYWSRNPIIIFLSLLLSSLAISMGIEKLKDLTGFNNLQKRVMNNSKIH